MGVEHTLPAHQWLKYIYDGFPSCLIGTYIFVHSPIDSSFDSLQEMHESELSGFSLWNAADSHTLLQKKVDIFALAERLSICWLFIPVVTSMMAREGRKEMLISPLDRASSRQEFL